MPLTPEQKQEIKQSFKEEFGTDIGNIWLIGSICDWWFSRLDQELAKNRPKRKTGNFLEDNFTDEEIGAFIKGLDILVELRSKNR